MITITEKNNQKLVTMIEAREDLTNAASENEAPETNVERTEDGKVKLTITGILEDLEEGLSNKDMATKYGLSEADIRQARQHPKLKNKRRKTKRKKVVKFVLEDDTNETTTDQSYSGPELKLAGEPTEESANNTMFNQENL